ncbi:MULTISPECIES: hypothetical protein [Tenacibaculum]|uniref:hypothetical protein n=1 Tax=Tenacibaculum TaxID=104267 RepID=UPI0012E40754|nr:MULTISPECIES: hypothetical protein [Tenacibaculum]KAF9660035.1 hypothetical protein HBA12_07310 [Tenacibaculum mesophilum]MCG7501704.1 transporter [Tenacibaculum sp. Mcav3-52]GFD92220.1 hypothetical protein KUL154_09530 [Alteromonas sp. KUL154]
MKKFYTLLFFSILLGISITSYGQGLYDGFTPKKNSLSITTSFTKSEYEKFYLGKTKQNATPVHEKINQNIYSLYAKYGITDRLSAIVSIPFIDATNTSNQPDPVNGLTSISEVQDISIALKFNAHKFQFKSGDLNIITGITTVIPTGYEPNGILSIGNGGFGFDLKAGLHLNTNVGFFSTIFAGYNLRGNADNNLTPGGDFGVPNAFTTTGKIGYASSFIYVEAWADYYNSEEGVDIGSPSFKGNFPETDVDYKSVGITVYKNILPKLGIGVGYGKVIDGRNIGESSTYSVSLTYNVL